MYISTKIADRIKDAAKHNGVTVKRMLADIGLGSNTIAHLQTSMIAADSLAKIADYLNVSVDYLLGRSDDVGTSAAEDANAAELLAIYNRLSPVDRAKLLVYADNLAHNGGKDGGD